VQSDVLHPVTPPPEVFHFLDKVEKREEHEQRQNDEAGRGHDLGRKITAQRPHVKSRRSGTTISRR
jgi:hypothetical protein